MIGSLTFPHSLSPASFVRSRCGSASLLVRPFSCCCHALDRLPSSGLIADECPSILLLSCHHQAVESGTLAPFFLSRCIVCFPGGTAWALILLLSMSLLQFVKAYSSVDVLRLRCCCHNSRLDFAADDSSLLSLSQAIVAGGSFLWFLVLLRGPAFIPGSHSCVALLSLATISTRTYPFLCSFDVVAFIVSTTG